LREKRIYFGALALLVLILLNLPVRSVRRVRGYVRDVLSPLEQAYVAGMRRTLTLFGTMGQKSRLIAENESLRQALAEREFRILELEQMREENEELRKKLGFAILSPRRLLLAEVTARGDLDGWWQTIRINKGHRDGVLPDMAVMTPAGIIGRTMEVTGRTSEVLLITDRNSKLSARIDQQSAIGVMQGAGVRSGGMGSVALLAAVRPAEVRYLPTTHEITVGDPVETSGLGHVFPAGLPIGRVVKVSLHESGLYQQAEVQPFADLRSLRHVFVVLE